MNDIIFDNKTLSDIFKDIYKNTESKRQQIDSFILTLIKQVKTAEDAIMIGPIIKDFIEVNVKNDEHIVRVAQIAQRAMGIGAKAAGSTELLTEEEKQQLLKDITYDIDELHGDALQVGEELERLRVK